MSVASVVPVAYAGEPLEWMAQMAVVYRMMPEADRVALHQWEADNLDGHSVGTSDWPGWVQYIGPPPWKSKPFPIPEQKRQLPKSLREAVYARDGRVCAECGATEDLSIDHIMPEALGGADDLDNLRVLCRPCNSRKGKRLPA